MEEYIRGCSHPTPTTLSTQTKSSADLATRDVRLAWSPGCNRSTVQKDATRTTGSQSSPASRQRAKPHLGKKPHGLCAGKNEGMHSRFVGVTWEKDDWSSTGSGGRLVP
eukprot:scaffold323415_cov35-Tisochrysis_lutea.AAC.2